MAATQEVAREHQLRGKALSWTALIGSLLTLLMLSSVTRQAPGRSLALVSLGIVSASAAWVLYRGRRSGVSTRAVFRLGLVTVVAILAVLHHAGVFSPASLALFLGVYYFGLDDSPLHGWSMLLVCAGGYALLAALAVAGVVDVETSLFAMRPVSPFDLSLLAGVLVAFLGLTFWLARSSRAATLEAIARLEAARQQISAREALLREARAELEQAQLAGLSGRYSGRQVSSWQLGEVIGRGAMGEVYDATDVQDGRVAAIKILHADVGGDPELVRRFLREASIVSSLSSPYVVRIVESGQSSDGSPFLAMERLVGQSLSAMLRERSRLSLRDVLVLTSHVADALVIAQDAGVVHRDLKPGNVFQHRGVDPPVWKVLDFGVSRFEQAQETLTHGVAVGTPSYMAPEQARGQTVDHRADVFALGAIVYRALTGRPAFTGDDPMTTIYNVVHVQPARPSELVNVPRDVELALALALAKETARRLPSAATFAAALRDAARSQLDERLRSDAEALLQEHPWGRDRTERPR